MKVMDDHGKGCPRRFGDGHMVMAVLEMQGKDRTSRKALSESLGVGEGSVKTIVSYLKKWGFVVTSQSGVSLTDDGREFARQMSVKKIDFAPRHQRAEDFLAGALVTNDAEKKITNGIRQLKCGVLAGADDIWIFFKRGGCVSTTFRFDRDEHIEELADTVDLADGNVLIICQAKDRATAEMGAMSAAVDLL